MLIQIINISICLISLIFCIHAYKIDKPFWFWNEVDTQLSGVKLNNVPQFNHSTSKMWLLFSIVMFIPECLLLTKIINEKIYIIFLCSIFTISTFIMMIYWHHLYHKHRINP